MRALAFLLGVTLTAEPPLATYPDFRDVAAESGLTQVFPNGGLETKTYIIETTGSGVALFDYDNDGLLDAFIVSGDGAPSRLYHNEGGGKFRDVSQEMGISRIGWGEGVCAGDYDNDGFTDLFVTYWGQNILYKNEGGKHFRDVTRAAGLEQSRVRYNAGCAFIDYDRDGRLDLFVSNYLKFSFEETPKPGANPYCYYLGLAVNCGPRGLPFERNILYHANPDGTFTDVSEKSGIAQPHESYCLSALTADFDGDGWPDIFVACDQTPSLLFMNQHDGTFSEEAVLRGVAFDDNGKAMSGMGAAAADYEHSGWMSIFRTNFSDERETLYGNNGEGAFQERTIAAGLGTNTRYVNWGCQFLDFDNQGWKGLFVVSGHVFPEIDRKSVDIRFRARRILYRNLRDGRFEDISEKSGPGILAAHSSRGVAVGDLDNDGVLEILVNNQGERPSLLRQTARPRGNWALLQLVGTRSNRSAIGAKVRVTAGGITQSDEVRSGGSYLSQSDLRLHFGLGDAKKIDRVEIDWPSGLKEQRRDLDVNRVLVLKEPVPPAQAPAGAPN
ncbi:MAG: CRTAC1 family protein [Bryobacteraceae bacterium]|nr:CRTAC1 family protein [Bryobacteraceae bacterium]